MRIEMAPSGAGGKGKGSGSGLRSVKEPRKYIAFRPPESVARKIHLVATGRGMTVTDYILEFMGEQIDQDFVDLAAQLQQETG